MSAMDALTRALRAALGLVALTLVVSTPALADGIAIAAPPAVRTTLGPVTGVVEAGSVHFRGIPYAQPPVGPLRWKAPAPAKRWTRPRDATQFGPVCMQTPRPGLAMSEDCLTLNISVPADAPAGERLPVLVRVHGGGFVTGSGMKEHAADVWTPEGVILVTLNYRMGALGFFDHPLLERAAAQARTPFVANLALLDIRLALQWVQANIAGFGGDPHNVTLTGVSAGGEAVDLLMVMPGTDGLFTRAIASSGYAAWPLPCSTSELPRHKDCVDASVTAAAIAARAHGGTAPRTLAELRAIPAEALVGAVKGFVIPVIDGRSVPDDPLALYAAGRQAPVPLMTGGNSYEGSVFPTSGVSAEQLLTLLGRQQATVRRLYAEDFAASEGQGVRRVFGDLRYVLSAAMIGSLKGPKQPTWLYYVTYVDPAWRRNLVGSPHAGETPLIERGTALPGSPGPSMRRYWVNFIRTGNPNGVIGAAQSPAQSLALPDWRPTAEGPRHWMVFGEKIHAEDDLLKAKLDALDAARRDIVH